MRKVVRRRAFGGSTVIVMFGLVFAMIASCTAFGLDPHRSISQYVQSTLTDRNGLPQSSVIGIAQTSDGYMWFGTEEGIVRFDGMRTTVFDTGLYKELKDNVMVTLTASRDGSLWVGTRTGLVRRMQDGTFRSYISTSSPITSIFESSDGRVWVGSQNGLYAIQEDRVRLYTVHDGLPDNSIHGIAQTPDGTLWLGTEKGLASLTNFKRKVFRSYGAGYGLPAGSVEWLTVSHDGSLWLATTAGFLRWKEQVLESWTPTGIPANQRVVAMLEDKDRQLWVGYGHAGVALDRSGQTIRYTTREGLPGDDVNNLFEDANGNMWIGLLEMGAVELRDGLFRTIGTQEGLSEDRVWSVLQAKDGTIWVGTNSKGLDHIGLNGQVHRYGAEDGVPEEPLYSLMEAADGSIWSGSETGALVHFKDGKFTVFRDPEKAKGYLITIVEQGPDDLLLGFHQEDGLVRFHHGVFEHRKLAGLVDVALIAPDASIWVGTDHAGITHIEKGKVTSYTTQNGLLSDFTQALYLDKDGVIWAGTSPGGLNRIKNGHITTYSAAQGLYGLTVGAIVEDDYGNLWMTCNKGIFRVSKKELNDYADGLIPAIHSVVYGTVDGMRKAECNFGQPSAWRGTDGRLWFATTGGVASIDERRANEPVMTPNVLIEEALFRRKVLAADATSTPVRGGGDLDFTFTAPDFEVPARLRFRYKLDGLDTDWEEVNDRREAYYTKLPPGHYVFKVQVAVGQNGWSSNTAQRAITLEPHVWQTTVFMILCGLILLLIGVECYRLRVRYLITRNRLLEEKVDLRTKELQDAIKVTEAAHQALHEQATKDSLTKLWNRRSIFEILEKEAQRARRVEQSLCVLMVDVDHFKLVNDTKGHLDGDLVLCGVAQRIKRLTRPYDAVGRFGGEEFLIVLPGCTLVEGLQRAEEFRLAIAGTAIQVGSAEIQVTCSFGVAAGYNIVDVEKIVRNADEALYRAKRAGRNRVDVMPGLEASLQEIL